MISSAQIFPPVQSFVALLNNTSVLLHLPKTYNKNYGHNQFEIVNAQGKQKLSFFLDRKSTKENFENVLLMADNKWRKDNWKAIETAYKNAPFFEYYDYKVKPVFDCEKLIDAIFLSYNIVFKCLGFEKQVQWTPEEPTNFVLKEIKYSQVFESKIGFIANASILDLLFNHGPMAEDILLE